MKYGFGPTYGQTVEWNGIPWTLTDVVEIDYIGANKFEPRKPRAPVTAPDGQEGIMYWAPICYPEVEDFDITKNILGVIICKTKHRPTI